MLRLEAERGLSLLVRRVFVCGDGSAHLNLSWRTCQRSLSVETNGGLALFLSIVGLKAGQLGRLVPLASRLWLLVVRN